MHRDRRLTVRVWAALLILSGLTGLAGCAWSPAASIESGDMVTQERQRLKDSPVTLSRPIVILSGYRTIGTNAWGLYRGLAPLLGAKRDDFLILAYPLRSNIDSIAGYVVERVNERWPSDNPEKTVEVDVIGISMGGLVARTAALPRDPASGDRRLAIKRLYTLGTPHRGARMAEVIAPDPAARAMKSGSDLLARLDEALDDREYELVCYARLNDMLVGAQNSSPEGMDPIWTNGFFLTSHYLITRDRLIVTDLALRIRGEEPIGKPGTPPSQ